MDGEAPECDRLAPIQFVRRSNTLGAKQRGAASRNDECRFFASRQTAQCRQVQVVIVIVGDQHGVEMRQILQRYSWISAPLRTGPGQRTRPLGPNWVR